MRIIITIGPVATDIASRRYLTHAQFIEYEEHRRRYGLNRLSSNEIEATWGMQLEDPKVPKDVVEGQPRISVGLWTDLFDSDQAIHKVFKKSTQLGPANRARSRRQSGSQPRRRRRKAKAPGI